MKAINNPDRDNWILSQKLLLEDLYLRIKQVVGEEVEEFNDREDNLENNWILSEMFFLDRKLMLEDNLENNWILSERFFLKLMFPFITQFMKDDAEDFCTWGHWVWKQGELLKDYQALKMEERAVSSLFKRLDESFARFIENARTTKTRQQFMSLRQNFANNSKKILENIQINYLLKKTQLSLLNKGRIDLETVSYYYFIIKELNKDPNKLSPEEDNRLFFEDNRLFFFVFHIMNLYISRKLENLN
uniref:Uncharacterized protein n=1 Tax=Cyphia angustiloba TaxID=2041112 RepID=A0A291F2H6_9ASTR|nr:hypothetical protein Cyp_ang1Pt0245 [Cyphia angustiloba]ATG26301.1 hypothetical protein Cyp_ang1Pt0245 [Cyphia angustiloba]